MPPPRLSRRFDNRPGFWKRRRREGVLLLILIAFALVWKSHGLKVAAPKAGMEAKAPAPLAEIAFAFDSTLWQSAELVGPGELIDSLSRRGALSDGEAEVLALSDSRLSFRRVALDGTVYLTKKPVTR